MNFSKRDILALKSQHEGCKTEISETVLRLVDDWISQYDFLETLESDLKRYEFDVDRLDVRGRFQKEHLMKIEKKSVFLRKGTLDQDS